VAEDILQEAYAKSLGKLHDVRGDSVVAWFYQVLRNALVDHYRSAGTEKTAHARFASETETSFEPEFRQNVCTCVRAVLPDLKPEYAEIVKAVELDQRPISEVAHEKQLTANNATVRLHRARVALRRRLMEVCGTCSEHGCLDCTCRQPPDPGPSSRR
jgi:RNA polymerase sigma-70 factor (ECF subfamily)